MPALKNEKVETSIDDDYEVEIDDPSRVDVEPMLGVLRRESILTAIAHKLELRSPLQRTWPWY